MALRPPGRTATAAACALLAAGGLSACHHAAARPRSAGRTTAVSDAPTRSGSPGRRRSPGNRDVRRTPAATPRLVVRSGAPAPTPRAKEPLPPVISHIPVKDKVVFITVDDGWEKDADFVRLVRERRVPLTLFLANTAIKDDYSYFRELQRAGALIEDHSMTHSYLPKLSYARQKHEICAAADIYTREYGSRPTLFRAPYGATERDTLRAARACGMKAVFFWREVVTGGRIAYQLPGGLHRGDILLVHFDPGIAHDFTHLLHTIRKQGFRPARMADYLPRDYFSRD
jgi:peptidoglycan/xylan/chitin deacetylase (PgdA/CDA1 family)